MHTIPFVIDNQRASMAGVLNGILAGHEGQGLDIATAYFNVGGWQLLREGLAGLGTFRLLLGDEPEAGLDLGLHEVGARPVRGLIRELASARFDEKTLRLVEQLVAFLRQDHVRVRLYTRGFLHAKCYLFYGDAGFERTAPVAAIVGSSNFTRAGLLSNKELNLAHRANLAPEEVAPEQVRGLMESRERRQLETLGEPERVIAANVPGLLAINGLAEWYERQWAEARDFKDELIDLLNASKFGRKEYSPYHVYMKAIYEYFRDDLADEAGNAGGGRSAVELSGFQEDAVKKARKILARYDGVMVADSVGLGKTWIGKKLLEDYAYHQRYKAIIICPAALKKMWSEELLGAGIAARIITQEALGREEYDSREALDADILLVDESHNFRNRTAQRYDNLERILAANGRRGRISNERKKLILLTATPINNNVFDLYNQVSLFTGGDRSYFAAAGIGDLQRYFMAARRAHRQQESGVALFNLLEEVVIRRTRPFIKQAYPNATIKGQPIHWPERRLKTIRYNLEATYGGIYTRVVERIEGLRLAPYRLEAYKKQGVSRDQFEEGREEALAGIFKSRYLKRFESSIDAFRISLRRALEFLETFDSYILDGKMLNSASFQKVMRYLNTEDEEDDATGADGEALSADKRSRSHALRDGGRTLRGDGEVSGALPESRAEELDAHREARQFIEDLPSLDAAKYDLKRLHKDVRRDIDALRDIWQTIAGITPERDAKLARLKDLLAGELKGRKVLLFTYYKDTARYLYRSLRGDAPDAARWRATAGEPHIRRIDSGADTRERASLVTHFAPLANNRPELAGSESEIDILISTDVLSEGQNLQDCGTLINYDLHWNPTRMVQRAGRIDRIGTSFDTLWVMNMFPDDGLERLLGLVESLSQKIAAIDRSGLLDVSILGEAVHPQNFNTLRRIEEEDGRVVEEQEQFVELVSSEFLLQNLKNLLDGGMREMLEELPDGIHSGLLRQQARGVFFYFTAHGSKRGKGAPAREQRQHYWRYIDLLEDPRGGLIEDNRYVITNLIQCQPDSARYVPSDFEVDIFALQEKVIASIVQSSIEQVAVEEAPRLLDPIQQTLTTILRRYVNAPGLDRQQIMAALRKLQTPQPRVYIKTLRKAYDAFLLTSQVADLLQTLQAIDTDITSPPAEETRKLLLKPEDLTLVCFDYIWQ
ncbi:MAG: helicase-related protein [Ktedonobacteraceae bacterium]